MTASLSSSSFVNVGERTNVTGSAKFRKLIEANDYQAALAVAATLPFAGPGMLMLKSLSLMLKLART